MKPFCLFFLLLSSSLLAQTPGAWALVQLSVREGLPDNNIFHTYKDSRGFLWISTQNGVSRWDGYEFKPYNYSPSDTNSLSGNWVYFTLEDRAGFLWFGTSGAGLCRFDPRTEHFERFPKTPRIGASGNDVVTCGLQDAAGILWLGTTNDGLRRFLPATRSATDFPSQKDALGTRRHTGPPSSHITCLLAENENTLWVGSAAGLSRFDKASSTFEYFLHDPKSATGPPHNFIIGLHRSKSGEIWVQTPQGWAKFDAQHNDFQRESAFPEVSPEAAKSRFSIDENISVWEATSGGVRHWRPHHNPFELGLNDRYPAEIFALKQIRNPLEHAGYLWVASEEGLFRAAIGGTKVEKLLPQGFHSLLADGPMLWAASKSEGLFGIETTTKTIQHYPAAPAGRGPSSNTPFVLSRDAWGRIWLGGNQVFDCFDPRTQIFSQPLAAQKKPNSSILSLCFDQQNRLWVGTYSEGIFVYCFDNQGNIAHSEQFRYDAKLPTSMSNDIVLAIWQDRRGDLWFGTDGGLNRLPAEWQSGQPAQFRRYLRSDGLADDKIMSIRDDAAGDLWVAHLSHGLSRLTPATGQVRTFGTADGLPSPLLYWTSAHRCPDEVLLFGTTGGLAAFHPDSLTAKNTVAPPIYFTDIQLFNEKIVIGGKDALLPESPIFAPRLVFSHEQNSLTFQFAALNFIHPESNRYAYRLEPLGQDWRALGTRHEVSFSHLPPGRYTLWVKACNNDGVWNEIGASLSFRIRPPWWQTPWAYALYTLVLGGGLWLIFRQQIRAAKRKFWQHFGPTLAATEAVKLPTGASSAELEFLQALYKVLENHLADEYFSVEQMAKSLSLSRTQLHRKVIEATGFSAGQLLQNQRLLRAQQLLTETNLSIAEVAFRCGFSDPNYFSRLFSKTQGLTPSEFAQQVRA